MHFSRKTILVVGAALLAACGDKVSVTDYTPPVTPAKVNSVEVSPATATLNVGQTITLTAAVNADAGLATTVTWSSSDASKASVSSAGVVTAVAATPGVAICATSTVDTGKKGCGSVVVTAPITPIGASVSIASITAANLNTPVNPAAVAGQIDVRLNVNPGNQTISKIVLVVGGVRTDSQTFTAAQSAALRYAADEAVAAQSTFPQVLFSVNTAKFVAATGVPTWLNGAQGVSAQLYTTQGGTATAATATAQTTLTFANANTYVLTTSNSGTTATGTNGYKYASGNLNASIIAVIYNAGQAFNAGTITFGSAGCDVTGPRTIALAAGTAPAYTATFTNSTGASAATNFRNYQLITANGACPLATGEGFTVTATDNLGNQLFAAAAPANNAANLYRMDNVAPGAPTLIQNPGARQNGWVNAAIGFTTTNASSAANGMVVNGAADAGIGGYTRYARTAAATGGLVDAALAATASSSPTLPAPSTSATDYCLVISAKDALGNESALPAAGAACSAPAVASATALAAQSTMFGVDIAPPTIAFSGGLASNGRLNGAAVGGEFQVTVLDTGTVGNSGMLSGSAVMGTIALRNATATGAATCFFGVYASSVCGVASVNAAPAFPLVATTVMAASVTTGYYTYTAYAQDAAGNASGTVTRVTAYDAPANTPTLTTAVFTAPLSSGSVTFSATAADNFDLRDVTYNLAYAGGLVGPIVYPAVVLNTYNTTLVNTGVSAGITIPNFVRQVEDVTGQNPITVSGAYKPNNLQGAVRDQVGNNSGAVNTVILAAQVTTGTSYTAALAPQLVNTWSISNAATAISNGATSPATNATSVTINADVFGPTATFNAPFARVDLYAVVGGQLVQVGTTTTYSTVDNGSAFGRRHRYSISWTPGSSFAVGAANLYAIGVNASGDALVTPVNANITVTNP